MSNGVSVSGLESDYLLDEGKLTLNFTVAAEGDLTVTNTLYDHGGAAKGQTSADIKDSPTASPCRSPGSAPVTTSW